ncbi:MAG: hypothetical protein ABI024_16055 [Vicinamibacterales bacterium]
MRSRPLSRSASRATAFAIARSLDHFHRVRDQFAKASIALSAYNISIKDDFSDTEIERACEMTAALGAPLITSSSTIATVARIAPVAERRKMLGERQALADPDEHRIRVQRRRPGR